MILIDEVLVGDIVYVKLGECVFVDGEVIEGYFVIDELMIMGESMFVDKFLGSIVIGVMINVNGFFKIRVVNVGKDIVFVYIIKIVEEV